MVRQTGSSKAEFVLLVECTLLAKTTEFTWSAALANGDMPTKAQTRAVTDLMQNRTAQGRQEGRHFFLPGAWNLPDLVLDFQRLVRVRYSELGQLTKKATLDGPYAEAMIVRFGKYIGRIGTPDLNVDLRLAELQDEIDVGTGSFGAPNTGPSTVGEGHP